MTKLWKTNLDSHNWKLCGPYCPLPPEELWDNDANGNLVHFGDVYWNKDELRWKAFDGKTETIHFNQELAKRALELRTLDQRDFSFIGAGL